MVLKKYKRILLEAAMILLAALLYGIYDFWRKTKPTDPAATAILSLLAAADVILLFLVMRALFKDEDRFALGKKLKALFRRIGLLVKRFARTYLSFGRNDNVVVGVTSVSFDYSLFKTRKSKQEKFVPPKWRDMKSAREKLGFVYYRLISRKIKRGDRIYADETPLEIKSRISYTEAEEEILNLYVKARYDDGVEFDEKDVLSLKENAKV